jgi:hypothetical protein
MGGSKGTQRKPEAHNQTFLSFLKLTQIRCRMSRPTEANVSCSSLSASVTCEHANTTLSSTYLQSIGRGGKPREPGSSDSDTPGPTAPEDPRAGVTSPKSTDAGAMHHPMPKQTPTSSLGRWPTPSTSPLTVPRDTPSAPDASCTSSADPTTPVFPVALLPPRASTGVTLGMR